MSTKIIPTMVLSDFTGGEASKFPLLGMPPKFSLKMQNCHLSPRGAPAKINGDRKVNNVAETGIIFKNGFKFVKTDGTVYYLVAGGGKIFRMDPSANTLTVIHSGLNATAKVRFSTINDICIMTNGVDVPLKTADAATVSVLGGTPPATSFKTIVHGGHVWHIERNNRLLATASDLNSPEVYAGGTAGVLDFKFILKTGDELLDVATFIDLIVFYFRNHIVIYSGTNPSGAGTDQMVKVQLIRELGVIGTDLIMDLGTQQMFLAGSGFKTLKQVVTTGKMNRDNVSEFIDPELVSEIASATSFATAHFEQRSWIMVFIDEKIRIYDYLHKAWGRYYKPGIQGLFGTDDGEVYICGTEHIYRYGLPNDWGINLEIDGSGGNDMEMLWEGAWIRGTKRGDKIYPKDMEISTRPGAIVTLTCDVYYDLKPAHIDDQIEFDTDYNVDLMDTARADVWDGACSVGGHSAMDKCEAAGGVWTPSSDPFLMDHGEFEKQLVPMFGGGEVFKMRWRNSSKLGPIEINEKRINAEVAT